MNITGMLNGYIQNVMKKYNLLTFDLNHLVSYLYSDLCARGRSDLGRACLEYIIMSGREKQENLLCVK